jgi:hypothetical protein
MPPKRKSEDASASADTAAPRRSARNVQPDEPKHATKAPAPKQAKPALSKGTEEADAGKPAPEAKVAIGEEIPDVTLRNENDEEVRVKGALGEKGFVVCPGRRANCSH